MAQRQFRSDDTDKWKYGFGNGSDGDLTISVDTIEAPIDASCSGTTGTTSLSATNVAFAAGQLIMVYQVRGTGVGNWELNKIAGYSAGTITTAHALCNTYTDSGASQAQVRVMKQYKNVTINSGKIYYPKAWDKNTGGVLAFFASGIVSGPGTINAVGRGFIRGSGSNYSDWWSPGHYGYSGEGTAGDNINSGQGANGSGGGGAHGLGQSSVEGAGGGGGHAGGGGNGEGLNGGQGYGGSAVGNAGLTLFNFGGGGGESSRGNSGTVKDGGNGGGGLLIIAKQLNGDLNIAVGGAAGVNGDSTCSSGGGGGAGGSVLIKAQVAPLGSNIITAAAGSGGVKYGAYYTGGAGSVGRIHVDYKTSYTGTTNPTLDATQDLTLDYPPAGGSFLYNFV